MRPYTLNHISVRIGAVDGIMPASDRAALSIAIAQPDADVVAIVPDHDEVAMRYALGAGVKRIATPAADGEADLCLIGRGGSGVEGDLMAARLATRYRAALVLDVLEIETQSDGLRVTRDLGRGDREVILLGGNAVLGIADTAPRSVYVSRYQQLTAKIPQGMQGQTPAPVLVTWGPIRLRTKAADLAEKTSGDARSRMFGAFGVSDNDPVRDDETIEADADTCAEHLIRYLAHHGFIDRVTELAAEAERKETIVRTASPAQMDLPVTVAIRVPQPIERPCSGLGRRPRPYLSSTSVVGATARVPRPIDAEGSAPDRGPFPVTPISDPSHG